jgi:hypothetical protein
MPNPIQCPKCNGYNTKVLAKQDLKHSVRYSIECYDCRIFVIVEYFRGTVRGTTIAVIIKGEIEV